MNIPRSALSFFACCSLVFADAQPGDEAFTRSSSELAAKLLLRQVQKDVFSAPLKTDSFIRSMTNAPASFVKREDAQKTLREQYRKELTERYQKEASALLSRLDGVRESFAKEALTPDSRELEGSINTHYDGIFRTARDNACAWQRNSISTRIKPGEKEFEETPRDRLSARLTERIAAEQAFPVFSENIDYIKGQVVAPILQAAEKERSEQRQFLIDADVSGWTPETIGQQQKKLLAKWNAARQQQREKEGAIFYGIFPSVEQAIPEIAKERAEARLARLVRGTSIPLDSGALLKTIQADPAAHRRKNDSLKAFAPPLRTQLFDSALASAVSQAPGNEKSALQAWGESDGKNAKTVDKAVSETVDRVLLPAVEKARGECAALQLSSHFQPLVSLTWVPGATLIDSLCAQSDWKKAVRAWTEYAELEDFARIAEARPLMEETSEALDRLLEEIFSRGRKAVKSQYHIVDDLYEGIRNQVLEGGRNGTPAPSVEQLIERYKTDTLAQWDEDREKALWEDIPEEKRPEAFLSQHAALFPSTVERIELKVRAILEALEKQQQMQEEIKEAEDEEQVQTPETPPEIVEIECSFELLREGHNIVLRCRSENELLAEGFCPEEPEKFLRQVQQTAQDVSNQLGKKLRSRVAAGQTLSVRTNLLIRDPLIYYGMVTSLSRALLNLAPGLQENGITMEVTTEREPE